MRYHPIANSLFIDRRRDFCKKMQPNAVAIFYSNDLMPRTGDQYFPFRQDSALFALSGLDQPGTILVLYPDARDKVFCEMAFILKPEPELAIWTGDRLTIKEAMNISGIRFIRTIDQWDHIMPSLILSASAIYVNTREQERFQTDVLSQNDRMALELKRLYPLHSFQRAQPVLRQLLMRKRPEEIESIKHAIHVTGLAFDKVLRTLKPRMKEYELEAVLTYILAQNGCQHAFEPIVASGKSACTLHYIRNDRAIRSDSLVLLDFGAEYANITSDMSRTIPASGRFTTRQRSVYISVLRILDEVTDMMRPGTRLDQLNLEAGKLIESELIRLKIITKSDVRKQDRNSPLWKKYFMHGISHHLGYDVHDSSDRSAPLKAGMVLTCEPGIYIPGENLGIRLENDILITKKSPVNLMQSIPIDPDEIESIMLSARDQVLRHQG